MVMYNYYLGAIYVVYQLVSKLISEARWEIYHRYEEDIARSMGYFFNMGKYLGVML